MDPEFLAELREEMLDEMVEDCVVSDQVENPNENIGASDGMGGILTNGSDTDAGTVTVTRNYKVRVTIPPSNAADAERLINDRSEAVTRVLVTFPWNAEVYITSKLTVTKQDGQVLNLSVDRIEPHSQAITLRVYATEV